jgi:hypothetical protein
LIRLIVNSLETRDDIRTFSVEFNSEIKVLFCPESAIIVPSLPVQPYLQVLPELCEDAQRNFHLLKCLNVAIIGSGLGGLSAAIALRRQGHRVTIYERYDFANEVGASLSVASNGSRFLEQWKVDIPTVKPVTLQKLIMRDWETGAVKGEYDLGDYEARFGTVSEI